MMNNRESDVVLIEENNEVIIPSLEENIKEREKSLMKNADQYMIKNISLFVGIIVVYLIILMSFLIILSVSQSFRYYFYDLLETKYDGNSNQGCIIVFLLEFILIISGFDIFIVDIIVGFIVKPYYVALSVLFFAKFIGKCLAFFVVRYCLREQIYQMFKQNLFFKTFYIAANKTPIQILIILQIITLPTIFKTYVVGVFAVTNLQYTTVTAISNLVWTAFWVHLGAQASSLKEYLETGKTNELMPFWIQGIIFFLAIMGFIYLLKLTKQIYQQLEKEVDQ